MRVVCSSFETFSNKRKAIVFLRKEVLSRGFVSLLFSCERHTDSKKNELKNEKKSKEDNEDNTRLMHCFHIPICKHFIRKRDKKCRLCFNYTVHLYKSQ